MHNINTLVLAVIWSNNMLKYSEQYFKYKIYVWKVSSHSKYSDNVPLNLYKNCSQLEESVPWIWDLDQTSLFGNETPLSKLVFYVTVNTYNYSVSISVNLVQVLLQTWGHSSAESIWMINRAFWGDSMSDTKIGINTLKMVGDV